VLYSPNFQLHCPIVTCVDAAAISAEPSLTLCSIDEFNRWSGPISRDVFAEVAATAQYQALAGRAELDPTVSIRVSVYAVWLERGDVPSQRPDWHIDRVGACRIHGEAEQSDFRDPLKFRSFILVSAFAALSPDVDDLDGPSTEFLLMSFEGKTQEYWGDNNDMHDDINHALQQSTAPTIVKAGNKMIASFCPRTVHRPGVADADGWRFLLRVGLYTALEPCSPYADHMVFYNPAFSTVTGDVRFRRVGTRDSVHVVPRRSVSLETEAGKLAAAEFIHQQSLNTKFR
jgi:hypothetical protein